MMRWLCQYHLAIMATTLVCATSLATSLPASMKCLTQAASCAIDLSDGWSDEWQSCLHVRSIDFTTAPFGRSSGALPLFGTYSLKAEPTEFGVVVPHTNCCQNCHKPWKWQLCMSNSMDTHSRQRDKDFHLYSRLVQSYTALWCQCVCLTRQNSSFGNTIGTQNTLWHSQCYVACAS